MSRAGHTWARSRGGEGDTGSPLPGLAAVTDWTCTRADDVS